MFIKNLVTKLSRYKQLCVKKVHDLYKIKNEQVIFIEVIILKFA